jgi:hypothetical protein
MEAAKKKGERATGSNILQNLPQPLQKSPDLSY